MLRVYACIAQEHDHRLVVLAGLIALFGSYTVIELLWHVRALAGSRRRAWLGGAALAAGSAIWATHFVAMLAFEPTVQVQYDLGQTAFSFLTAIVLTGLGLVTALHRAGPAWRIAGGTIVGVAIAAMHYAGMAGMHLPGSLVWDLPLVGASILIGCSLAAMALALALSVGSRWRRVGATGLLALSICGLHFTGMAAATIVLSGQTARAAGDISSALLALLVAFACAGLLLLGIGALRLARTVARQQEAERTTMRELADIAGEGLLVCTSGAILTVNTSLLSMLGTTEDALAGRPVGMLFDQRFRLPRNQADEAFDCAMSGPAADTIPVRLKCKQIDYSGVPHLVIVVSDLRQRRRMEEMHFLAHHDSLTGLANRVDFGNELDRQFREQSRHGDAFALLTLDLDRFKNVNDTFGHQVGDVVLKQVASRLQVTARATDKIARLGGDEFAIIAGAPVTPAEAGILAQRVIEAVSRPYTLADRKAVIGISVGVSFAPLDAHDATTLLRTADLALYRAKDAGGNAIRFFESAMDQDMQERRSLELALRYALAHDEIEVFYQPLFDVKRQRVTGFEALARWQSPALGLLMPAHFIPLAEETGLILALGRTVLTKATKQAVAWGGTCSVSVNLSPVQFAEGNIVRTVAAALKDAGLPAHRLELEITENVLLRDGSDALATLTALRQMGVRIAMDDFGSGYSSLGYIRTFPFDTIKVDRSFVNDMLTQRESAAIVGAVLWLGRRLGITTIAEGVETEAQRAYLEKAGCDMLQGYLIGRPVCAADAAAWASSDARAVLPA